MSDPSYFALEYRFNIHIYIHQPFYFSSLFTLAVISCACGSTSFAPICSFRLLNNSEVASLCLPGKKKTGGLVSVFKNFVSRSR
jgi:hypothetical protein